MEKGEEGKGKAKRLNTEIWDNAEDDAYAQLLEE